MDRNAAYLVALTVASVVVGSIQAWEVRKPASIPPSAPPVPAAPWIETPTSPSRSPEPRIHRAPEPTRTKLRQELRAMHRRLHALEHQRQAMGLARQRAEQERLYLTYLRSDLQETIVQLTRQVTMLEALLSAFESTPLPSAGSVSLLGPEPSEAKEEAQKWEDLARQLLVAGWIPKASEAFYRALSLKPQDPNLHYNQGVLADRFFKEPGRALFHFQSFLAFAPEEDPDAPQVRRWVRRFLYGPSR